MSVVDVILERETANDDDALVVAIHVASGTPVGADDLLFEIENSKATQESRAPNAGILVHNLEVGHALAFGVSIAQVLSAEDWAARAQKPAVVPDAEHVANGAVPPRSIDSSAPPIVEVMLERETANDESASVVAIHVASGTLVAQGQLIFDIENSKATQEVVASRAGILQHDLAVGDTVGFGVPIATLIVRETDGTPTPPALSDPVASPPPRQEPPSPLVSLPPSGGTPAGSLAVPDRSTVRFSKAAAALIAELSGSTSDFASGFITADDVRARFAPGMISPPATPQVPRLLPQLDALRTVPGGQPVSPRKRAEIEALRLGAGDTLLSVLGITVGPLAIARDADAFLEGRVTDLVIYEAARLMRKFPKLNAFYTDGQIVLHDAVHAGLAIDDGGRLIVYGIENADQATLGDLVATIGNALLRYVDNELTAKEMSRATFTVTDLSADGLDFILPLLPRGQSCILGITHNDESGFRVFAGFDHRVTEGREVSRFLSELKQRLLSFAAAPLATTDSKHCLYCDRSAQEAFLRNKDKGLLKIADRHGREAFCCASCWQGW